jgi:hypothetical protein
MFVVRLNIWVMCGRLFMLYTSTGLNGCSESVLDLPLYEDGRDMLHINTLFQRRTMACTMFVFFYDICDCSMVLNSWWWFSWWTPSKWTDWNFFISKIALISVILILLSNNINLNNKKNRNTLTFIIHILIIIWI